MCGSDGQWWAKSGSCLGQGRARLGLTSRPRVRGLKVTFILLLFISNKKQSPPDFAADLLLLVVGLTSSSSLDLHHPGPAPLRGWSRGQRALGTRAMSLLAQEPYNLAVLVLGAGVVLWAMRLFFEARSLAFL